MTVIKLSCLAALIGISATALAQPAAADTGSFHRYTASPDVQAKSARAIVRARVIAMEQERRFRLNDTFVNTDCSPVNLGVNTAANPDSRFADNTVVVPYAVYNICR